MMVMQSRNEVPVDKGWAWVVAFASCAIFSLCAGSFKCQGIILVELIERYTDVYPPSTLIWIFSVNNILSGALGPLGSIVVVKVGYRKTAMIGVVLMTLAFVGIGYSHSMPAMILSYSIPGAFAATLLELCVILINDEYFVKKKALALGIVMSGSGFGSILVPFVMRPLYDNFTYSGATLLYGGYCLQFLIMASLLRPISYYQRPAATELLQDTATPRIDMNPLRQRSNSLDHLRESKKHAVTFMSEPVLSGGNDTEQICLTEDGSNQQTENVEENGVVSAPQCCCEKVFNWRILLIPKFLVVASSIFCFDLGVLAMYSVLPALADEYGVAKDVVAIALIIGGILEIPSRILNGLLADRHVITTIEQYALCTLLAGVFSLLCALIPGLAGVSLGVVGVSAFGTSFFNLVPVLLREIMGSSNLSTGVGMNLFIQSIAFLGSSYIIGSLYDATKTWVAVFYFFSVAMILCSCITWPYSIALFCKRLKLGQGEQSRCREEV